MNIYNLISNTVNVKSRKCFSGINEGRNQEKGSKGTNGSTSNTIRQRKAYSINMQNFRGTCKARKALGISLLKFSCCAKSSYSQAWQKSQNFLIFLSLFYMPFIVNNLTYFMLLDFSVIGYDIQAFNNIGVHR